MALSNLFNTAEWCRAFHPLDHPKAYKPAEVHEPRQKSVTDAGLDYAAGMKPVSGSGDCPRGPPATKGPSESPMPQMGWPSVAHEPARCPEQAGVTASWLRTSRDRDDPSISKAACSGGAATPEQGGVTATWPLASRDRAYFSANYIRIPSASLADHICPLAPNYPSSYRINVLSFPSWHRTSILLPCFFYLKSFALERFCL